MDLIYKNAKAVVAFILAALLQAVTDRINTGQALPSTLGEWGRFLGLSLLAAVVIWVTGNKQTADQVTSAVTKLTVPEQKQVAQTTLDVLPTPVSDKVVAEYPKWAIE